MAQKPYVFVCGGAGYIGSHMVRMLHECGFTPVVIDDLSTGYKDSVADDTPFAEVSLLDRKGLQEVFAAYPAASVMHFAAKSLVGESVENPLKYYENNVAGTITLLGVMKEFSVERFIFSSTAAVYGQPGDAPLTEEHPLQPINPYGSSKMQAEMILGDAWNAYGISSVCLRYFNAAGAHPDGSLGERHNPETHLIPNLLRAVKERKPMQVFGDDYPTPDGTCIRDYIHIQDLCNAHLLALAYLEREPGAHIFNLGTGTGYSIREIIEVAEKVTGEKVSYTVAPRRAGDPASLVAHAERAKVALGWKPVLSSVENIISTAWQWHKPGR